MNNILPFANIQVEVLTEHCWQNCEDFEPWMKQKMYATCSGGTCVFSRYFECRNLEKCKRLSLYLERSEEK